jgi:hypothetical protein
MKSSKEIKEKLDENKAEANKLLTQYNNSIWDKEKDIILRRRSQIQERINTLEWVLGINEC